MSCGTALLTLRAEQFSLGLDNIIEILSGGTNYFMMKKLWYNED